jgi:hemerythrin
MTTLKTPDSMTEEHHELFRKLRELAAGDDQVAGEVRELLKVLEPHFEKEEKLAMPLLGVLKPLSKGEAIKDRSKFTSLHERFLSEYPRMLEEHKRIKRLIEKVRTITKKTNEQRALEVMDELEHHAALEEEVLYPVAVLVLAIANANLTVHPL